MSNVQAKEKEDSEKLAVDVEKPDFKPNEVIDPNPNYPELPTEILEHHNSQDFGAHAESHQDVVPTVSLQDEPHAESESDVSSSAPGENYESVEEDDSSSEPDDSGSNESK